MALLSSEVYGYEIALNKIAQSLNALLSLPPPPFFLIIAPLPTVDSTVCLI